MMIRICLILACATLFLCAGCHQLHPSGDAALISFEGSGFAFNYDSRDFRSCKSSEESRLTMEEIGTDIPYGNAPARIKYVLKPVNPAFLTDKDLEWRVEPSIQIIPLKDATVSEFSKAYPELTRISGEITRIVESGSVHPELGKDLPDWNCVDHEQTIHAKADVLKTPWCAGIQFLTTYVQEASAIGNDNLTFKFEGVSHDGAYFIAVEIPIFHPSLPIPAPAIADAAPEEVRMYYGQVEEQLNRIDDSEYTPSIASLRAIIQSMWASK